MKWIKFSDHWECVFVNVPFKVLLVDEIEFIKATLLFTEQDFWMKKIATKTYSSVELAKAEVHLFILDHLAQYSEIVHHECLEANVITWRKLKEQLDQIPEDQLDEPINHLDTDGYWVGEPRVELAKQDQYAEIDDFKDVTGNVINPKDYSLVIEKGKYFLSTCNV